MREIVASGAGLGFVSEAEFGNDPRLRKVALNGPDLGMAETLVSLTARRDVPAIRAFMKALT
jgi:DNA-binding transcriptional LysR family regulator